LKPPAGTAVEVVSKLEFVIEAAGAAIPAKKKMKHTNNRLIY
jgi:hypothetical protein